MTNCKSFEEMNTWRVCLRTAIKQIAENVGANYKVINPCDYYRLDIIKHQSEMEVFKFDLSKVKESDLTEELKKEYGFDYTLQLADKGILDNLYKLTDEQKE